MMNINRSMKYLKKSLNKIIATIIVVALLITNVDISVFALTDAVTFDGNGYDSIIEAVEEAI